MPTKESVKMFKTFRGIIKGVDKDNHIVDVIVSNDSVDRHQEAISHDAYKKRLKIYKDHPILLSSHGYHTLTNQIGQAEAIKITDEGLRCRFKYFHGEGNAEADWAFNLASKGIAAYSVGFIAHEVEEMNLSFDEAVKSGKPTRIYKDVELIEVSQVLVPSNRQAIQENKLSAHKDGMEDAELYAELCTKALETADLIPATPVDTGAHKDTQEDIKKGIEDDVRAMVQEFMKMEDIAQRLFEFIDANPEAKKLFKTLIQESIEDIVSEGFYNELIFGKQAKGHDATQGENLGNALKDIARNTRPSTKEI